MNDEIVFDKYRKRGPSYHWRQISRSITGRNIFVIARYNMVLKQIGRSRDKKILDIGCGDGVLSYMIARQTGAKVIGVDTSAEAIAFARKKTTGIQNVEFMEASAYRLPFDAGSFDYVVSSDVIEHLQEPEVLLSEMKRVFNEKGRVIITTPLRFTEMPLDKMHVKELFQSDFRRLLIDTFGDSDRVKIIESHPLFFMELQNRHIYIKMILNLLNLLGFNPFEKRKGWRYYAMQTAVIEGQKAG